jgi:hypothetical protein
MNTMKTTALPAALALAALLALRPAAAAPDLPGAQADAADRPAASQSESPMAAFERMLAPRMPTAGAARAPAQVDPLLPAFHLALWSKPADRRHASAARTHAVGVLQ